MKIKCSILGCGDAFNSDGRFHTCFLLESDQQKVLLDCGPGALQQLKAKTLTANQIDAVVLTHFHGDHFGGMPFLLLDMARHKRKTTLHIFCPPGGKTLTSAALKLFYPGKETLVDTLPLEWHEYGADEPLEAAGLQVKAVCVEHAKATKPHGVRITIDGKVISYSGDSGWCPPLIELADGADLFICDCTFFKTADDSHLNYKTLAKHRRELTCKRLLLTHFDDEMIENSEEVEDGMAYDGQELWL